MASSRWVVIVLVDPQGAGQARALGASGDICCRRQRAFGLRLHQELLAEERHLFVVVRLVERDDVGECAHLGRWAEVREIAIEIRLALVEERECLGVVVLPGGGEIGWIDDRCPQMAHDIQRCLDCVIEPRVIAEEMRTRDTDARPRESVRVQVGGIIGCCLAAAGRSRRIASIDAGHAAEHDRGICTVRQIGPGVSWRWEMGTIPARLNKLTVGLSPTSELHEDGRRSTRRSPCPQRTQQKSGGPLPQIPSSTRTACGRGSYGFRV